MIIHELQLPPCVGLCKHIWIEALNSCSHEGLSHLCCKMKVQYQQQYREICIEVPLWDCTSM